MRHSDGPFTEPLRPMENKEKRALSLAKTWELNHKTNQTAKCCGESMSVYAAPSPPAHVHWLGRLLTLTTGFLALTQGSQCSAFSRNCLFSESTSLWCCRVLGWCPGWSWRKAVRAWLQGCRSQPCQTTLPFLLCLQRTLLPLCTINIAAFPTTSCKSS